MEELYKLGFNEPKVLVNKQGIEVYVPEDENSRDWLVHIPGSLLTGNKSTKEAKTGFNYYNVSKYEVLRIVEKYSGKEVEPIL